MWAISFKELKSTKTWENRKYKLLHESTSTEFLHAVLQAKTSSVTDLPGSLVFLWITTWVNCFCSWVTELRTQLKASTGSCSNHNKHMCWLGHSTLWGRLKTCNLVFTCHFWNFLLTMLEYFLKFKKLFFVSINSVKIWTSRCVVQCLYKYYNDIQDRGCVTWEKKLI